MVGDSMTAADFMTELAFPLPVAECVALKREGVLTYEDAARRLA